MLCEFCKKNEASVHFKQLCNGEVREMDICPECAEKQGFDVQSPLAMTDFLFGLGSGTGGAATAVPEVSCPACHMRPSDYKKSGRLGCPRCYEAFADQLEPILSDMHDDVKHVGKVLAKEKLNRDLKRLNRELEGAITRQNFEQAAVLRDQIKALRDGESVVSGEGA